MNKVFVYGTLKSGHWNNGLLRTSRLVSEEAKLEGLCLYRNYPSFPVSYYEEGSKIIGELWEVDGATLTRLDQLESEGYMYNRETMTTECGQECMVYVGNNNCWSFNELDKCNKNEYNEYRWA